MLFPGNLIGFIPTVDAARARSFYEGTLGMRFVTDDGFALVLEANGAMVRIVRVGDFTPARFTILGWEVVGLANLVTAMTAAGVRFEHYGLPGQGADGIWIAPGGAAVAWFKDPDGNVLSLSAHAGQNNPHS